jgi:hypothetical protein
MNKSDKKGSFEHFEKAFRAEVNRIWKEGNGAPTATAIKFDKKAKAIRLNFSFADDISNSEATASVQRFVALFEETALKRDVRSETKESSALEAAPSKDVAASISLSASIGFCPVT